MKKSESIKEIASALVSAQKEMRHATKDSANPFFKSTYAGFSSVWDACREALNKNGIAVTQVAGTEGEEVVIETMFMHTSGEWMSGELKMKPVKSDPQGVGSAITYARRYALSGMACLATEEDDDGNAASKPKTQTSAPPVPPPVVPPPVATATAEPSPYINRNQQVLLFAACKDAGMDNDQIKRMLREQCNGIDSTTKLTPADLEKLLVLVRDPVAMGNMRATWAREDFGM